MCQILRSNHLQHNVTPYNIMQQGGEWLQHMDTTKDVTKLYDIVATV